MKKKKDWKPKVQMRQVHWSRIKPKDIQKTIWKDIDDERLKMDFGEVETLFKAPSSKGMKKGGGKGGKKKNQVLFFGFALSLPLVFLFLSCSSIPLPLGCLAGAK